MDLASRAALLKQGGLVALAALASYLAWDFRKEFTASNLTMRELQKSHADQLADLTIAHASQIAVLQQDRIDDLKADRTLYVKLAERITEEMTRGRMALEGLEAQEEEDDGSDEEGQG